MGVPTKTISIDRESALEWPFPAGAGGPQCCVAMTAETLTLMRETSPRGLERLVQEGGAQLLVFDCGASTRHDSALSWLTKGALARGPGQRAFLRPAHPAAGFSPPRLGQDVRPQPGTHRPLHHRRPPARRTVRFPRLPGAPDLQAPRRLRDVDRVHPLELPPHL